MLNLIYKLINKLIAARMKPYMEILVDLQHTGFIVGKSIFYNILAFKVGKEYV